MAGNHKCEVDNKKIEVMVALGAATAVNCIPCFDHLYEKALLVGLSHDEIRKTVDIATKVKNGAHVAISGSIRELMGDPAESREPVTPCGADQKCSC